MGFLTMSGNELQRIEVLAEILSGRRTEVSAKTSDTITGLEGGIQQTCVPSSSRNG